MHNLKILTNFYIFGEVMNFISEDLAIQFVFVVNILLVMCFFFVFQQKKVKQSAKFFKQDLYKKYV